MKNFKIGDRVRALGLVDSIDLTGKVGTVVNFFAGNLLPVDVDFDESFSSGHSCNNFARGGHGRSCKEKELELIINLINNKTMNIKEKFILALTKEPQKSFRKTGITNGDDILTEDGEKVFLSWLLHTKFAEEFKKNVVQDMLEEQKKEEEKK